MIVLNVVENSSIYIYLNAKTTYVNTGFTYVMYLENGTTHDYQTFLLHDNSTYVQMYSGETDIQNYIFDYNVFTIKVIDNDPLDLDPLVPVITLANFQGYNKYKLYYKGYNDSTRTYDEDNLVEQGFFRVIYPSSSNVIEYGINQVVYHTDESSYVLLDHDQLRKLKWSEAEHIIDVNFNLGTYSLTAATALFTNLTAGNLVAVDSDGLLVSPYSVVDTLGQTGYSFNIPTEKAVRDAINSVTGSTGSSGTSGFDGTSGTSGSAGVSGSSGISGVAGIDGSSGVSGTSGTDGLAGTSGTSGVSGADGTSGTSGTSGGAGASGTAGTSGTSGAAGATGTSGTSGTSGAVGVSGTSGTSGVSGAAGTSGTSGTSGAVGVSGTSGTSGASGNDGTSGTSGTSGAAGVAGTSGTSGTSGTAGTSGTSGATGTSGTSGTDGADGIGTYGNLYFYHNEDSDIPTYEKLLRAGPDAAEDIDSKTINNTSGKTYIHSYIMEPGEPGTLLIPAGLWSSHFYCYVDSSVGTSEFILELFKRDTGGTETFLFSGSTGDINHTSVQEVVTIYYGMDIPLNIDDRLLIKVYCQTTSVTNRTLSFVYEGTSHASYILTPIAAPAGTSGTSGVNGTSGTSGTSGNNGTSGTSGTSGAAGTSGTSGTSGTAGTSGTSGTSGAAGTSGTSGAAGATGTSGTSGTSGAAGATGTSGTSGVSGAAGTSGTSGTSGAAGTSGTSGTSGAAGTSGTSGTSGATGAAGTSGTSGKSGSSGTSGATGTSGTSGTSGAAGGTGTSGTSGKSGSSGTSGSGTAGTSGLSYEVENYLVETFIDSYSGLTGTTENKIAIRTDSTLNFDTTGKLKLASVSNVPIIYTTGLTSDHSFSGDIATFTAGDTFTIGQVGYYKTDAKIYKANATGTTTSDNLIVLAVSAVTSGTTNGFLLRGFFRDDSYTWNVADKLYLSLTAGSITNTAPSAATNIVRIVGYSITGTTIWFDPDKTYIQI